MKPKGQGKKGTEKATLANLAGGRRAEAAPRKARSSAGARGPGRPAKYADTDKPQRVGVYLPPDLLGWLFEEVARRKQERRDASISEIVAEALAALRG